MRSTNVYYDDLFTYSLAPQEAEGTYQLSVLGHRGASLCSLTAQEVPSNMGRLRGEWVTLATPDEHRQIVVRVEEVAAKLHLHPLQVVEAAETDEKIQALVGRESGLYFAMEADRFCNSIATARYILQHRGDWDRDLPEGHMRYMPSTEECPVGIELRKVEGKLIIKVHFTKKKKEIYRRIERKKPALKVRYIVYFNGPHAGEKGVIKSFPLEQGPDAKPTRSYALWKVKREAKFLTELLGDEAFVQIRGQAEVQGKHRKKFWIEMPCYQSLSNLLRLIWREPGVIYPLMLIPYAREVIKGVANLCRRHIIHRDLKPGNLLLDAKGRIVIADFGSACKVDEISRRRDIEGTKPYFPPEIMKAYLRLKQGRGSNFMAEANTLERNAWELGCILQEMGFMHLEAFQGLLNLDPDKRDKVVENEEKYLRALDQEERRLRALPIDVCEKSHMACCRAPEVELKLSAETVLPEATIASSCDSLSSFGLAKYYTR